MGHPAGKGADGLHLLGFSELEFQLSMLFFRSLTLHNLLGQFIVDFYQLRRTHPNAAFQRLVDFFAVAPIQFRRRWKTDHCLDFLQTLVFGVTDEDIEHFVEGEAQASDFVEHLRKNLVGDALAVDEHAVAIEND